MPFLLLLACVSKPAPVDSAGDPDHVGDSGDNHVDSGVDTSPVDTAPVDTSPDESGFGDSGSGDSGSGDSGSGDSGSGDSGSGDSGSGDSGSGDSGSGTWRSTLYPSDWTPALTDGDGRFLHDFSYAGYHASEEALPSVAGPLYPVDDEGADPTGATDSTVAIQAAIDAAAASGGGVVVLSAGTYLVDDVLTVTASNVVIRGAGAGVTFVRFTRASGMSYLSHLTFRGTVTEGPDLLLSADGASRDTTVYVDDASSLSVGDRVHLGWVITDEFVAEHGMTDVWYSFNGQWRPFFRRTVVAVDTTVHPNAVTLDVPLRYLAQMRDSASLRTADGYLTEVGVEDLSVTNVATWADAWAETQTHAIELNGVEDGWVRGVSSYAPPDPPDALGDELMSGGILVTDSRRVTIADTTMAEAQNRGDGGNGYLFEIRRSNEILTEDSVADAGRHNFIQNWDFGTTGCVWLRTLSENARAYLADWDPLGYAAYSEFHHSLAMANLIDESVATDGWQGVNRQAESSGAGHSVTESVFWNLTGGGYLRSLQYGYGYVIGTDAVDLHVDPAEWDWANSGEGTEPEDWTEGIGDAATLEPQSLFEDQLVRRVGSLP